MEQEETIKVNLETIWHYAPYAILAISTLIGLYILSPLYAEGTPMDIDLAMHYGRMVCFEQNPMWSLSTFWCPKGQAGIASFQAYALMPFHLMSIFNWIMPLAAAYKLMLMVIFFLLPVGAFLLLQRLGYPLGGSIAYLLLVVEHGSWHGGGLEKIFHVGLFSNAMGSGMLLVSLAFALLFFEKPTYRNLAVVSAISAAFFLSHAATFMFFPPCLLILAWVHRKTVLSHMKTFIAYPFIVFLLVSYWLIPFIAKSSYYVSSGGGNVKLAEIQQYLLSDLSWTLLIISLLGLLYALTRKDRNLGAICMCALLIPSLWLLGFVWPAFPYFSLIQMIRNLAEARSFILIFAGLLIGAIAKTNLRLSGRKVPLFPIALIMLYLLVPSMYTRSAQSAQNILMSSRPEFQAMNPVYDLLRDSPGRVLTEDTLFFAGQTAWSYSHPWAMSAAVSPLELLGTGDNLYNKNDYSNSQLNILFDVPLEQWTNSGLVDLFNNLNIKHIVAYPGNNGQYSQPYLKRFENYSSQNISVGEGFSWTIFDTGIKSSYFMLEGASLTDVRYDGWSGSVTVDTASGGDLLFKVRQFPNWKVTVDGIRVETRKDARGMTMIPVPVGKHTVEMRYGYVAVDVLGYVITFAGVALIMYLLYRKIE